MLAAVPMQLVFSLHLFQIAKCAYLDLRPVAMVWKQVATLQQLLAAQSAFCTVLVLTSCKTMMAKLLKVIQLVLAWIIQVLVDLWEDVLKFFLVKWSAD